MKRPVHRGRQPGTLLSGGGHGHGWKKNWPRMNWFYIYMFDHIIRLSSVFDNVCMQALFFRGVGFPNQGENMGFVTMGPR